MPVKQQTLGEYKKETETENTEGKVNNDKNNEKTLTGKRKLDSPSPSNSIAKLPKIEKHQNDITKEPSDEQFDRASSLVASSSDVLNSQENLNKSTNSSNTNKLTKSEESPEKSVSYAELCQTFEKIESTTKRLEIISYIAKFFKYILEKHPSSLVKVIYLFINKLAPDYEGVELGIGESLIIKAISESTGRSLSQIKLDYKKIGDLGTVAQESRASQKMMFTPKLLTVDTVFDNLKLIATCSGTKSQNRKIAIITKMLTACKGKEAKYLIRSLEGKLRIRVSNLTVLPSLSRGYVDWVLEGPDSKLKSGLTANSDIEEKLKSIYCELPSYDKLVPALIKYGIDELHNHCRLTPGFPPLPMLAKPTKSVGEVLDRFSDGKKFTCEYKYDGERAQIHLTNDGSYHVYSRNSEDMSSKYPDILESIKKFHTDEVKSFIIDSEAVAWDRKEQKIMPFQILSTRKRKDVETGEITVRVCIFAFDLLYLNGQVLLEKSLEERRKLLVEHFKPINGEYQFATSQNHTSIEEIQSFLDMSIKDSCEGLMIKSLVGESSYYRPSIRTFNWLKLKKDYLEGIGDSIDLVVLGAYFGKGKRTNFYGAFLLGCFNQDSENYETICKIGTGFSDEMLSTLYDQLSKTLSEKKSYIEHDSAANTQPDVWFQPSMVWEVKTADLSLSPVYKAAQSFFAGKGVSLRFPRFIKIRDDKTPEESTTSEQIADFYRSQAHLASQNDE